MNLAPIAFFAYKRPEHTLQALTSLSHCELAKESRLYIFCDGPKTTADQEAVLQVQAAVSSQRWCGGVEVIRREENLGLSRSIIAGTTELCREFGRVIVLEDDLLLAPQFLQYMNNALERYQAEEQVMQVSGYMFPVDLEADTDAVFLPFISTWGWATWQRAWRHFDPDMSGYAALKQSRKLRKKFDLGGAYPYFAMLELQRQGKIDSWGIRWYLSAFLRDGLTLFPVRTLVQNIGFDGSGTHCGPSQTFDHRSFSDYKLDSFPDIGINSLNFDHIKDYLKGQKTPFISKCLSKLVKTVRNRYRLSA